MALVSANIDAITKDGLWRNVHVGIVLATLGGVACVMPSVAEWCIGAQVVVIGAVWKLKLVLPDREPGRSSGAPADGT